MCARFYGTLEGFKYLLRAKPMLGAYVAMEGFGRDLLRYGSFDEYHAYYEDGLATSLAAERETQTLPGGEKLVIKALSELVENPGIEYETLHFEQIEPYKEIVFRNLLRKPNVPVTRRVYTISTIAHLRGFLNICLLNAGGRPYDSIIAPSGSTKEVILEYLSEIESVTGGKLSYRGRVDVIPYAVDVDSFRPRGREASRAALGLPVEPIILLSVARISWSSKMNYDRLLGFFSQLTKESDQELMLLIAGADPDGESEHVVRIAEKLGISREIRLLTDFNDELKEHIFGSSDIFVSLGDNLQESFGISLVEAMASGLPVICTDWDGYKDIVEEGRTGFRIPATWKVTERKDDVLANFRNLFDHSVIFRISRDIAVDGEQLMARALELVRSEDMRREMGRQGRRRSAEVFSTRTVISRYEELWRELGEIAARDRSEYRDLSSVLYYDYPRHFRSYPTGFSSKAED